VRGRGPRVRRSCPWRKHRAVDVSLTRLFARFESPRKVQHYSLYVRPRGEYQSPQPAALARRVARYARVRARPEARYWIRVRSGKYFRPASDYWLRGIRALVSSALSLFHPLMPAPPPKRFKNSAPPFPKIPQPPKPGKKRGVKKKKKKSPRPPQGRCRGCAAAPEKECEYICYPEMMELNQTSVCT